MNITGRIKRKEKGEQILNNFSQNQQRILP
jgi:hypothetical protein